MLSNRSGRGGQIETGITFRRGWRHRHVDQMDGLPLLPNKGCELHPGFCVKSSGDPELDCDIMDEQCPMCRY